MDQSAELNKENFDGGEGSSASTNNGRNRSGYSQLLGEVFNSVGNKDKTFSEKSKLASEIWDQKSFSDKKHYSTQVTTSTPVTNLAVSGPKHLCGRCGKKFGRRQDLNYHKKIDCDKEKICVDCRRKFACYSSLQRHIRTAHKKERFYNCPVCNKQFVCKTDLVAHHNIHDGIRFSCGTCGTTFSNRSNLLRHAKKESHILPTKQ